MGNAEGAKRAQLRNYVGDSMDLLRQAAQMALEALDSDHPDIQLRAAITLRAALAQPEWDEVFDAAVYAWKARTPGRDALRLCFQDKSDDSEIFTHWTSRELMDFAARIATLYTAPPQRKPLTDDLARATSQCNAWWATKCKAMLDAEREAFVAIINDNTDGDGICCADDLLAALDSRASMEKGE